MFKGIALESFTALCLGFEYGWVKGFDVLKWIDIPPVWLIGALVITRVLAELMPGQDLGWARALGAGLVGLGIAAMLAGLFELWRRRTTFVPRQVPTGFARGGIYRLTRNPIYLGDALVLAGAALWWNALPALLLVPIFMKFVTQRYIRGEEEVLLKMFGDEAEIWFGKVRRWL